MRAVPILLAASALALPSCGRPQPVAPALPAAPARADEPTGPVIVVAAVYPGANARTVADTVAAPIEQQVTGAEGLTEMESESSGDGGYTLLARFQVGTDPNVAQVLVQNRLSIAGPTLPEETRRLGTTVRKSADGPPAYWIAVRGDKDRDESVLGSLCRLAVKPRLAQVPGVAGVELLGQPLDEWAVWLDPVRLAARGLTAADVEASLRTGGRGDWMVGVRSTPRERPGTAPGPTALRVSGAARPDEVERLTVKVVNDRPIYLRDVARVERAVADHGFATVDGAAGVLLAVTAPEDKATADAIRKMVSEVKELHPGVRATLVAESAADSYVRGTVELPDGASSDRTREALRRLGDGVRRLPNVGTVIAIGDGRRANVGTLVVLRKDGGPTAADLRRIAVDYREFAFRATDHADGRRTTPTVRLAVLDVGAVGPPALRGTVDQMMRRFRPDRDVADVACPGLGAESVVRRVDGHAAAVLVVHLRDTAAAADVAARLLTSAEDGLPKGLKVARLAASAVE